jgi:carbonic anhydrase
MESTPAALIGRRSFLRLGTVAGLAIAIAPTLRPRDAEADEDKFCNPDRPSTPQGALQELIIGNGAWAGGTQTHPGEDALRRECIATDGQSPFAAIISCSDSRVPPELIFDQGLGDLFVARVAGNVATGSLAESLYYGTGVLGSLVLFVLGHTDCGAVKAAVASYPSHHLEFVKLLFPAVKAARKIVRQNGGDPNDPNQVVPVATNQNVIMEVEALKKSEFFKDMVDAGTLLVAGGVYDLDTQLVTILTP